jgi:hypothetical protein
MGAALSRSLAKIFGSKEMRLLMLGLDAAGKTSTSALCLSASRIGGMFAPRGACLVLLMFLYGSAAQICWNQLLTTLS